jgi:putative lipoic acid-binding regulatory protein
MDLARLKALLEKETYPHSFVLKFIGNRSAAFTNGVESLEKCYPTLSGKSERASSGGAHLALTYVYPAQNADQILALLQDVARIPDLRIIL